MDTAPNAPPKTRIQERNRRAILKAALTVFSAHGFAGATLAQIAQAAGLSKPNLLYYFANKDAIYDALLLGLLDTWLDPLRALDPDGDPVEEVVAYVLRKLEMSRHMPAESRLFANEIVQGAPRIHATITGPLKAMVDEKAGLIQSWIDAGRLAPTNPHHLIFSIWATTQHYADFQVQVDAILAPKRDPHLTEAGAFLSAFYRRALTPS